MRRVKVVELSVRSLNASQRRRPETEPRVWSAVDWAEVRGEERSRNVPPGATKTDSKKVHTNTKECVCLSSYNFHIRTNVTGNYRRHPPNNALSKVHSSTARPNRVPSMFASATFFREKYSLWSWERAVNGNVAEQWESSFFYCSDDFWTSLSLSLTVSLCKVTAVDSLTRTRTRRNLMLVAGLLVDIFAQKVTRSSPRPPPLSLLLSPSLYPPLFTLTPSTTHLQWS